MEEKYEAPTKHLDALKEDGEYYGEYSKEMIDYVEDKRIEINSVIAELDDNARFWGWIIEKGAFFLHEIIIVQLIFLIM